jgi:hypothetical protein
MANEIKKIILKTQVMEDIFQNGYPQQVNGQEAYDFIFEVTDANVFDSIRDIKGLMQDKYQDYKNLISNVLSQSTLTLQINKDEFVDVEDYEVIANSPHATKNRAGTADEFITFKTINLDLGDL